MNLFKYDYLKQSISFELENGNVMVNATQMAKLFGKNVGHFLANDGTKKFIKACLNNRNSDYLNIKTKEDLVKATQKSGTWMHRILALKFAAWLDPYFEIWVFSTIDEVLYKNFKSLEDNLKQTALRRTKIAELRKKLKENKDYTDLQELERQDRTDAYRRGKINRNQLDLFQESYLNKN